MESQVDFIGFLCGLFLFSMAAFSAGFDRGRCGRGDLQWLPLFVFSLGCGLAKWLEAATLSNPGIPKLWVYAPEALGLLALLCLAGQALGLLRSREYVALAFCGLLACCLCLGYGEPDLCVRAGFGLLGAVGVAYGFIHRGLGAGSRLESAALAISGLGILFWAILNCVMAMKTGVLPFGLNVSGSLVLWAGVLEAMSAGVASLSLWTLALKSAADHGLPWRLVAMAQSWLLALLIGLCVLAWSFSDNAGVKADEEGKYILKGSSVLCAKAVNPGQLKSLTGDIKDYGLPQFKRLNGQLSIMSALNPSWRWCYLLGIRDGRLYSLIDSMRPGDPESSPALYDDAPLKVFEMLKTGQGATIGPYKDQWGVWISALTPVFDDVSGSCIGLFGIDVAYSDWMRRVMSERFIFLAGAALICLLLLAGVVMAGLRIGVECSGPFMARYAETCHIGIIGLVATLLVTGAVWRNVQGEGETAFKHVSIRKMESFLDSLLELRQSAGVLGRFLEVSSPFDQTRFNIFASAITKAHDRLPKMLGVLNLKPGVRPAFTRMEPSGGRMFEERLLESPQCEEALRLLESEGLGEMAGPFRQGAGSAGVRDSSYILFQPIDMKGKAKSPGLAIAMLWSPQAMIDLIWRDDPSLGGDLSLSLYEGPGRQPVARHPQDAAPMERMGLAEALSLSFFGRDFIIRCTPGPSSPAGRASMEPWLVFGAGMALSLSLTVLAYMIQSARRRAEELVKSRTADLQRSQERFDQVSEQSREMIWEIDLAGVFTYVSKGAESILGFAPEELAGKRRIQDFPLSGEGGRLLDRPVRDLVCELADAGGRRVWVSRNAIPVKDAAGKVIGFRGSDYDIGAAKRAEDAYKRQAAFLQDMIDAIPNPVYYKNTNGEYLGCNKAFEEYIGVSKAKLIGRNVFEVSPPEFAERYHKMDMELIRTGGVQRYEALIRLTNGSIREAFFNKAVFKNPDGSIGGFIGVIVDISERKRIETERLRNEAHLDSLLRLSQFHSKSLADLLDFALEQALRLSVSPTGFIFIRGEMNSKYTVNSLLSFDGSSVSALDRGLLENPELEEVIKKASRKRSPFTLEPHGSLERVMAVPVFKGDELADAILIVCGKLSPYESNDSLQLSLLMESIWKIYERNVAEENVRQDLKSLGIILNILHMAMEDVPLKNVLNMALNGICTMSWFDFTDKCAIQLCDEATDELQPIVNRGADFAGCGPCCKSVSVGECVCGAAAAQRRILFVKSDESVHSGRCQIEGPHAHCSVPILYGQSLVGVLNLILNYDHQPSRNEENFLQALAGVLSVIIQRRRADEELLRVHEANKTLINSIPTILITLDKAGNILQFNPTAERLLRKKAEDVIGRRLDSSGIEWDYEALSMKMEAFWKAPAICDPEEIRFVKADGVDGILRLMLGPTSGSGADSGAALLLVASDVTEQRSLETQLLQAQKLEAIGQLAAGIAHEINTPTQYIGDNLLFLQDSFKSLLDYFSRIESESKGRLSPELAASIKAATEELDMDFIREEAPKALLQAIEGVSRIAEIVHAMKEFSHPGSKGKTLVDINKSLVNTFTVARNEWKYVADMNTSLAPDLPLVPCIPGEINQVFLNIIVNAAHAIGEVVGKSGRKGTIDVSTAFVDGQVEIRIGDSGCGIPESIRARIFEPFFTTKGVGKGTGQGLSIARGIVVKKHGGELFFESEEGVGTTFVIRLPVSEKSTDGDSHEEDADV